MKVLIISDKKRGHENQSIAYCKLLNAKYDIVYVKFKNKFFKLLSYLFDFLGIYTPFLYKKLDIKCNYDFIVSAGSETYYANKIIAKRCGVKNIALMKPSGYKNDFYKTYIQMHDGGSLPVNFNYPISSGIYKPAKKSIGIIIGGDNKVFSIDIEELKNFFDFVFERFKDYEIAITSSPRTSKKIEELIEKYPFSFKIIYSKNPVNPIGDFLVYCKYVFITMDSTSMISEAVCFGKSCVEVIPLKSKKENKYIKFIKHLENMDLLHIFDGDIKCKNKKIDLKEYI